MLPPLSSDTSGRQASPVYFTRDNGGVGSPGLWMTRLLPWPWCLYWDLSPVFPGNLRLAVGRLLACDLIGAWIRGPVPGLSSQPAGPLPFPQSS